MNRFARLLASIVCAALVVTAAPLSGYEAAAQIVTVRVEGVPVVPSAVAPVVSAPSTALLSPALSVPSLSAAPSAVVPAPALGPAPSAPLAAAPAEIPAAAAVSVGVAPAAALAASAAASAPSFGDAPAGDIESRARAAQAFDGARDLGAPQIVKHDGYRFEFGMDVRLDAGRKNVYRVGTYLFVPHALGITPASFPKESFYQHIQRRIRFKTPRMTLAELLDGSNGTSPLNRLAAMTVQARSGPASSEPYARAYTEIRMLGVIAAAALRDQSAAIASELPARRGEVAAFVADARRLADGVRALRSELDASGAPPKIRDTAALLDEYVSLSIVEQSVPLLSEIRKESAPDASPSPEDRAIVELIKSEDAYRAAASFPSVVDKATDSEALFYRRAVLKSLFSSVLALDAKTGDWSGAFQVLFGVSAAVAMALFLGAMQYVNGHFQAGSIAVVLAGVAGYVVKDRIKEILRSWTTKRWRRTFYDAVTAIRDPETGDALGTIREFFDFVPRGKVPEEIMRIRNADALASIGEDGKPEDVIHYEKEVSLSAKAIAAHHTRRRDLDDSLLFNLFPFFENTEDSRVAFTHLDPVTNRLEALSGSRAYHLNIVTRHEVRQPSDRASASYARLRVVMDRDGIKRIEKVPVP